MSIQFALELLLFVLLLCFVIALWRSRSGSGFTGYANFSEAAFHTAAAIGLVLAGAWVILQQDWAPKASIDVKTSTALLGAFPSQSALIQVAASVKNEGRVPYNFRSIRFAAAGYNGDSVSPSQHGDIADKPLGEVALQNYLRVMPGETDFAYAEFRVPCSESAVQILVKIAHPAEQLAYERKGVVPLRETCALSADTKDRRR